MVIDYKRASIRAMADLINAYQVAEQITFAANDAAILREFKGYAPNARTKNWLGRSPENIMEKFSILEKEKFRDITEVQLHLNPVDKNGWRYELDPEFIRYALKTTAAHGVLLQVLPWEFDREDLFAILDLGVRSFAVDYPNQFKKICADYFSRKNYATI